MWAKEIIELWIGHLLGSNEEPMQPELTHSSGEVFHAVEITYQVPNPWQFRQEIE